MGQREEVCGTCRWHKKENGSWVCSNPDSDLYSDWTEYGSSCEEHEERINRTGQFR